MIKWNEVTWYSRMLTGIFFLVVLPLVLIFIAGRYKEVVKTYSDTKETLESSVNRISTQIENATNTPDTATTTP